MVSVFFACGWQGISVSGGVSAFFSVKSVGSEGLASRVRGGVVTGFGYE